MKPRILLPLAVVALSSWAWGQDRTDNVLLSVDAGVKAADYFLTMRNLQVQTVCRSDEPSNCWTRPGIEQNPLARPFVTHGKPMAAGYFAGMWLVDYAVSRTLRKHGHPKLARAVLWFGIAQNGGGAIYSAGRH